MVKNGTAVESHFDVLQAMNTAAELSTQLNPL